MILYKTYKKTSYLFCLSLLLLFISCGFSKDNKSFFEERGNYIWFRNEVIKIRIDRGMFVKVYYKQEKMGHSLVMAEPDEILSKPSHYVIVEGREVKDFTIVPEKPKITVLSNSFGAGKRLIVKGVSDKPAKLEKNLIIELYDKFPDTAIIYAVYRNLESGRAITISKSVSNSFRLDASLVNKTAEPYEFWSFQGITDYDEDWIVKIGSEYMRRNYTGVKPAIGSPTVTSTGQGIPMVDLWTKKTGIASALVEPLPKTVSFPVKSDFNNTIRIEAVEEIRKELNPGESYRTYKYAVIVHTLDYFTPLRRLRELLVCQGKVMQRVPKSTYLPVWSTSGFGGNYTLSDIYNRFKELQKLNTGWVILDRGWSRRFGEWFPSKDIFPDGEKSLREIVYLLHENGFRVMLWWLPLSVHGDSDVARKYPGWFIRNRNGGHETSGWGSYYICPSLDEVKMYNEFLVKKFITDWNIDGLYIDGAFLNTVPLCHAKGHNHQTPGESQETLADVFKVISKTAVELKPEFVVKLNPGGVCPSVYNMFYYHVPSVGEPPSRFQLRGRIKALKGFFGSNAPVSGNYYEDNRWDFVSYYAPGGILSGKFTTLFSNTKNGQLSPQRLKAAQYREKMYERWYAVNNKYKLYNGECLNLYDAVFDKPEAHVIKKGSTFYYSFFAQSWKGKVELRGLEKKKYRVNDYIHEINLGTVKGPRDYIKVGFKKFLLLEVVPE
ncbi:DUF6259 domain-containing protein [candidate division KSB1 bacterium]